MVTTFVTTGNQEAKCPACGASFKAPSRRVQCPKCRQTVTLELAAKPQPPLPVPPKPAAADAGKDIARLEALETRVAAIEERPAPDAGRPVLHNLETRIAALEECLKHPAADTAAEAARPVARPAIRPSKLQWLSAAEPSSPDISPAQEEALIHNLSAIRGQAISIRTIAGNTFVRQRAEAFKSIFERAGWTVRGIDEIPRTIAEPGLSLAVASLPVEKEAAAAYLALKAAGFAPVPVLDSALATGGEGEAVPLSLTVAPGRAG